MGSPQMNFINAVVTKKGSDVYVNFSGFSLKLPENKAKKVIDGGYEEKTVRIGIRPEDIHDEEMYINNYPESVIEATVRVYELLGAEVFLYFTVDETLEITARVNPRTTARPDDTLKIAFDMSKLHVFDNETEKIVTN
jgi:multiple sugar transport system ATP-binding protein